MTWHGICNRIWGINLISLPPSPRSKEVKSPLFLLLLLAVVPPSDRLRLIWRVSPRSVSSLYPRYSFVRVLNNPPFAFPVAVPTDTINRLTPHGGVLEVSLVFLCQIFQSFPSGNSFAFFFFELSFNAMYPITAIKNIFTNTIMLINIFYSPRFLLYPQQSI